MFLRKKRKDEEDIKTGLIRNIAKVVLWVGLLFVIYKGVISIVRADNVNALEDKAFDRYLEQIEKNTIERKAISFAENFAIEYMTFYGDNDDYEKRLNKFSDLEFNKNPNIFMEAVVSNWEESKWIKEDELILVDCFVKVKFVVSYLI